MVPFAGFAMPIQYTSIFGEHRAVRERAGLFDVSHMGQIHLDGPGAVATAERLLSCPVASLGEGRVRYGLLCNDRGGVVDDVTVYRLGARSLLLCVNAANIASDYEWILGHSAPQTRVEDRSPETALLALQGPAANEILDPLCNGKLASLKRFRFRDGEVAGIPTRISQTGYTGSPGYELYLPARRAGALFRQLLEVGAATGLLPAGLGARDTLRLEAALPLYGHELDTTTTPLEAGLERFTKLDAGGFLGAGALRRQRRRGLTRRLAGFLVDARAVVRADHHLFRDGERVGIVTSGTPAPTLGKSIGLGYVPPPLAVPGTRLAARVRDRDVPIEIVATPFLRTEGRARAAEGARGTGEEH